MHFEPRIVISCGCCVFLAGWPDDAMVTCGCTASYSALSKWSQWHHNARLLSLVPRRRKAVRDLVILKTHPSYYGHGEYSIQHIFMSVITDPYYVFTAVEYSKWLLFLMFRSWPSSVLCRYKDLHLFLLSKRPQRVLVMSCWSPIWNYNRVASWEILWHAEDFHLANVSIVRELYSLS